MTHNIIKFEITGNEFSTLQEELKTFYDTGILFESQFDLEDMKMGKPINIPRVAVSHANMGENIIIKHNLSVLPNIVKSKVNSFAKYEYDIVNCWATDMKQGSHGLLHHHLPAEISGVYYYEVGPNDSQIHFMLDNVLTKYESRVGVMYFWPSATLHCIPFKEESSKRRSISFNLIRKQQ